MADVTVAASPPETINVRRFVAFIAMIAGMFMAVLSVQIVGSSFKEIQAALGAAPDEVSWVLTAALIAEVNHDSAVGALQPDLFDPHLLHDLRRRVHAGQRGLRAGLGRAVDDRLSGDPRGSSAAG